MVAREEMEIPVRSCAVGVKVRGVGTTWTPPGGVKVTLKTVDTNRCREKPSRSFLYLSKSRNFWE